MTFRASLIVALAATVGASAAHAKDNQTYEMPDQSEQTNPTQGAQTYEVSYEGSYPNARGSLGIGLSMPGFVAFQGAFQSFGGIVDGLYLDARFTGTALGDTVFGERSPLFENSFETDLRVGFGTRNRDLRRATIRDQDGYKIEGRIPDAFGVAPWIGWRGRWGYDMQAVRMGLHVERAIDAEVIFGDGRVGNAFSQWSFDFELFYALRSGEQEKMGVAFHFDHYINNFVFTRWEIGYAAPHEDQLAPQYESINALDGIFWKAMLGFTYQFQLNPRDRSERRAGAGTEAIVPAASTNPPPAAAEAAPVAPVEVPPAVVEPVVTEVPAEAPQRSAECSSTADCDDGVFCNGRETCTGGVCLPGSIQDDNVACTQLICDEESQEIRFEPMHGLCGDGQFCNGTERCDVQNGCVAGSPLPVDDRDDCTRDYCDESTDRLVNEVIPGCAPADKD